MRSNADGMAEAVIEEPKPEGVLVMARRGDDFAVASLYGWTLRTDADQSMMGYVYTDRPVYRPGHTVHFRAILRNEMATGYQIPTVKEVQGRCRIPTASRCIRRRCRCPGMGTVHGDFDLPASAALGYYGIEIHAGEDTAGGGFNVEEYKKPEYEVRVTPSKKRVVQGEPIQATIDARYYFGEPVANAKVKYVVHRSRYWHALVSSRRTTSSRRATRTIRLVAEGRAGRADGHARRRGQADHPGAHRSRRSSTSCIASKRASPIRRSARSRARATRSPPSAATTSTFRRSSTSISRASRRSFNVEARDYEASRAARGRSPWTCMQHEWRKPEGPSVGTDIGRHGRAGQGHRCDCRCRADRTRRARSRRRPRAARSRTPTYIWVTGGYRWYGGGGQQRVEIVPDKKSYKPGENARVLIVTGVPDAYVWVTVEGRALDGSQLVHAKGGSATVEIPIVSDYAPNFFVTAAFLKDQRYYAGPKSIKVPPVEHN